MVASSSEDDPEFDNLEEALAVIADGGQPSASVLAAVLRGLYELPVEQRRYLADRIEGKTIRRGRPSSQSDQATWMRILRAQFIHADMMRSKLKQVGNNGDAIAMTVERLKEINIEMSASAVRQAVYGKPERSPTRNRPKK